jgi:hypothetical protein
MNEIPKKIYLYPSQLEDLNEENHIECDATLDPSGTPNVREKPVEYRLHNNEPITIEFVEGLRAIKNLNEYIRILSCKPAANNSDAYDVLQLRFDCRKEEIKVFLDSVYIVAAADKENHPDITWGKTEINNPTQGKILSLVEIFGDGE